MASTKRQRQLARETAQRRLARRAEQQRKMRQRQAAIGGALALIVIVVGTVWLLGGFSSKPQNAASEGTCTWYPKTPDTAQHVYDTGTPPATGELRSGATPMHIQTNLGQIDVALNNEQAPCTAASFQYLAGKGFFDNSTCHRLTTAASGISVLQCGDPSGTGSGGPSYGFANEYVPAPPPASSSASPAPTTSAPAYVTYPKGTVAMAHSSEANSNGSQFFIVYADSQLPADYTIFGTVSAGLDLVEKAATAGAVDAQGKSVPDGTPKTKVTISSLTVGNQTPAPTGSASPTASATPTGSATPSGTPTKS